MYTIVIADDEKYIRKSLIQKVDWESIGFKIVGEAQNGAEALELVEQLEPDLLLTDIKMPYISGIELARQVREIRPVTQIVFLSGYDDFAYAQSAIQYNVISYLLKPITSEKITEEFLRIREKMNYLHRSFMTRDEGNQTMEKNHFLLNLLMDEYTPEIYGTNPERYEAEALCEAAKCGILQSNTPELISYVVMVTAIVDSDGKNCTNVGNVKAVGSILSKYLKHSSVIAQRKVVSLIMGTKRELDKYLSIAAEDIAQSVERILGCRVMIGISDKVSKITNVHLCYKDAMSAFAFACRKKDRICFASDEMLMGHVNKDFLKMKVDEIENLFMNGEESALEEYINEFYCRIQNGTISNADASYIKMHIIAMALRLIVNMNESMKTIQIQNVMKIFEVNQLEREKKYILELLSKGKQEIRKKDQKTSEDLCSRAVDIISKEYSNPSLSLGDVSSVVGITPNYLTALLKKGYGLSFKEILTKKRMETAMYLLQHTAMKVWEVSEKSGYSEQHYFSYSFKKYTGDSPNAYRKKFEEHEEV